MALASKSGTKPKGTTRVRVNPEDILSFVTTQKETNAQAVADKFGCSKVSASQNLDKLAEAKKIVRVKADPSKKLSPVTYKAK